MSSKHFQLPEELSSSFNSERESQKSQTALKGKTELEERQFDTAAYIGRKLS